MLPLNTFSMPGHLTVDTADFFYFQSFRALFEGLEKAFFFFFFGALEKAGRK